MSYIFSFPLCSSFSWSSGCHSTFWSKGWGHLLKIDLVYFEDLKTKTDLPSSRAFFEECLVQPFFVSFSALLSSVASCVLIVVLFSSKLTKKVFFHWILDCNQGRLSHWSLFLLSIITTRMMIWTTLCYPQVFFRHFEKTIVGPCETKYWN